MHKGKKYIDWIRGWRNRWLNYAMVWRIGLRNIPAWKVAARDARDVNHFLSSGDEHYLRYDSKERPQLEVLFLVMSYTHHKHFIFQTLHICYSIYPFIHTICLNSSLTFWWHPFLDYFKCHDFSFPSGFIVMLTFSLLPLALPLYWPAMNLRALIFLFTVLNSFACKFWSTSTHLNSLLLLAQLPPL